MIPPSPLSLDPIKPSRAPHSRLVRLTHWIGAAGFLTLLVTGYVILMAHPRLYWGETGNNLMPALIELPISKNHKHGGWENTTPFSGAVGSPVTANRTFDTFNENSWGRSLHFLAAWVMMSVGGIYLLGGIFSGHFTRNLVPRLRELRPALVLAEFANHMRLRVRAATGGPQYGLLQKCAYFGVVFIALPGTVLTGLTMAPAVTAAHPWLLDLFGGFQSARTIHFFLAVALALFLAAHVLMVIKSGFKRQMRSMSLGEPHE